MLAACGGGGGGGIEGQQADGAAATTVKQELADEITVSNWPYYIDQNDDATRFPTLEEFEKETGVKVNYLEDINSNEEFFGEIQALPAWAVDRQGHHRAHGLRLAARLLGLGYLQKLDKSAIPNMTNLEDTLRSPPGSQPRLQPALAVVHHRHRLRPGEGRRRSYVGLGSSRSRLEGKDHDARLGGGHGRLFLLEMGVDPSGRSSRPPWTRRSPRSRRPWTTTKSASSRATTTQGRSPRATWASVAWSGDIIILQPDNPNLKFVILDAGGMTSVDTMVIPTGGDVYTASTFMNFFYDPEVAAKVTAYVNYITPVKGTKEAITKIDPAFARTRSSSRRPRCWRSSTSSTPKRSKTLSIRRSGRP